MRREILHVLAATVIVMLLAYSGINPYDRTTWVLEVFPILVVLPILIFTYKNFPLTNMLYALIFIHAIVLMVGGTYTYARVPLGFEIADILGWHRNPYDKIGHFMQGFVPAIAAREILIRRHYVNGQRMLTLVVVCIVLSISASYELIEWGSAVVLGQGADEFLGTQGDSWDTQSDMLFALIGSVFALLLLSTSHDQQITEIKN